MSAVHSHDHAYVVCNTKLAILFLEHGRLCDKFVFGATGNLKKEKIDSAINVALLERMQNIMSCASNFCLSFSHECNALIAVGLLCIRWFRFTATEAQVSDNERLRRETYEYRRFFEPGLVSEKARFGFFFPLTITIVHLTCKSDSRSSSPEHKVDVKEARR